jgi:hypothetical protein
MLIWVTSTTMPANPLYAQIHDGIDCQIGSQPGFFESDPASRGKLENNNIIHGFSYLHKCGSGKEVK